MLNDFFLKKFNDVVMILFDNLYIVSFIGLWGVVLYIVLFNMLRRIEFVFMGSVLI